MNANKSNIGIKALFQNLFWSVLINVLIMTSVKLALKDDVKWNESKTYTSLIPSMIAAAGIGFVTTIILKSEEAINSSRRLIEESEKNIETLSNKVEIQDAAFDMLIESKHIKTIRKLLNLSLKEQCRYIPLIQENNYLELLEEAINESNTYEGVQKNLVSWFNANSHVNYLIKLRDRRMDKKRRIFLIDRQNVSRMEEELQNEELMDNYWNNTGRDVKTFWISESEFQRHFPNDSIPQDLALYDSQLVIKYLPNEQTLYFNVLNSDSVEKKIFDDLERQISNSSDSPFTEIIPN